MAQNWRPIAISNVDYRLLARVLNARLAAVASRLVAEGQTNAVPGRRMGTSLALMRELFLAAAGWCWRGLLVQLDQSKAFDRVDRAYLWAVLRARGVPEGYICLLQRLYERATAVPMVEGWRGEPQLLDAECLVMRKWQPPGQPGPEKAEVQLLLSTTTGLKESQLHLLHPPTAHG
ncbi:hypothetical protein lerEdw1_011125 [Lerista edwardsae]|nr:hypothetical protein lerEdw1_011125 [Lerista edwardsae]